ncbi:cyclic nucleotide-binding/CBS domain-containing protein [Natronomonas sp. LN261]|jgi:CBS domain-containing protein|uniref:CBS domain-containing protein n=1 Tax=Natronomonas sp. LN261 TaxID=2750669 RepID=UPI0015EFC84A|nr:CBS domain-containing protein [Natronomonas sp. LN261]
MTEQDAGVEELMSSPVESVPSDTTMADAARTLTKESIGSLVVGDDRILGIVTESDLVSAVGEERAPETPIEGLMSDPVVTVRRSESVRTAAERMGHNGVKKLPVVEDGKAIGIITTTDLALHLPDYQVNMAHQAEADIVDGEWE